MVNRIGIMGCSYNSINMGCVALHDSLLLLLEDIRKSMKANYEYHVFDFNINSIDKNRVCEELGITEERIHYHEMPVEIAFKSVKDGLRRIKHFVQNKLAYQVIKTCDVIIDLTQGDSFSDVYGKERFYQWTKIKEKIEQLDIPLILGPQTYGPFIEKDVREYAKKIIENASLVISRDEDSREHILQFCDQDIIVGTDVAFGLPYTASKSDSERIRVGINPSGLLGTKKNDRSNLTNELTVSYDLFIHRLIDWLLEQGKYEIHLIPHVGNEAIECFGGIDGVIYHEAFTSPIEAKKAISSMDIFVGARMHATIAALSSGVATIPTAYSMKFAGVFKNIGYNRVIDLRTNTNEGALKSVIDAIAEYEIIHKEVLDCKELINKRYEAMENALSDFFSII